MPDILTPEQKQQLEKNLAKGLKQTEKSVVGFFIRKYRITYLLLCIIIAMGTYALLTLPKEAEPEINVPFAVVSTSYPGASPRDVEELVTNKLEEKIKDLENMKSFSSSSGEGLSLIHVEFRAEADMRESIGDLKDAVDLAKPELPDDADNPFVQKINFNDMPIVTYSFVGNYGKKDLKNFADILQKSLEEVKDVSKVNIVGGDTREFQILANQNKLTHYGISLNQIINAVRASNFNLPAGQITIEKYSYGVRVQGQFKSIADLSDVVVTYYQDTPIYIKDVAQIIDGFKERKSESKIGIGNNPAKNTISLQVYKQSEGNILNIAKNCRAKINKLKKSHIFPGNLKILTTNDNSVFIKKDVRRLGSSGIQTTVLIMLLLFIVLGIRGSIIAGLSVPIAFLTAFIVLMYMGMTINSMVLFALVLSLGLMVDNAIIIMEGINEYLNYHHKTPYQAALLSVWNYKWAITAGTLTTVAAFLPMLLVSGIMGEYMGILPKTISAALLASLFVALVIIPALAAKFYHKKEKPNTKQKQLFKTVHRKLDNLKIYYVKSLRKILPSKRLRRLSIFTSLFLLIIALLLPITGLMRVEMFPKIDFDYFVINIKMPVGSTLEKTSEVIKKTQNIIREIPELDNYVSSIGSNFNLTPGVSGGSGTHLGSIMVNLITTKKRKRMSYEIAESIRPKIEKIQAGEVRVEEMQAGPPTGAPVEIKIFGDNLKTLSQIGQQIKNILKNTNGLINIKDSVQESTGEFTFTIDREKVKYYGLNVSNVASSLREAIYGTKASSLNPEGNDVDIIVKYDDKHFNTATDLENLLLFTPHGQTIKLKQISTMAIKPAVLSIDHENGEKIVKITAETTQKADLRKILKNFKTQQQKMIHLPKNYHIKMGGETEDIQKSFREIFMSMFVAIFLIMFILILQFNSFKIPFVIIFTVPLAIVGAFFGLTILRLNFSLPAFIGIVSLSGIVVNDAIVLIDRINKNLKRKMDFYEGIIEAGLARMQPIFLTSLTTIVGVLPLALSDEMWAGLGFAIIFGLLFSTILTLVFVPIMYTVMCRKDYVQNLKIN